ncbi:MAG: Uncharacterized protein XD58_1931 [Thermotoga sp. 50_1627]|uniref:hypothetical protein n=1 Tax=Pseudothermotoga sp. TaxID=2033661 RepID=UPI00076C4273|nr:MAG: Uncharacterized protein XD58_1931 [Thermotoga sp. 50_1627]MBC7115800.1 hypothetical protein [Pseudothermotoga sp.]MDK2923767.1 hypothetical protein [Pseudothermotoga sp.]HBT38935.1 hypothetical protein [Pseudothermotoga sp.]HCO97782.1 hypothetical protein [Pseudothermotoga sp.]
MKIGSYHVTMASLNSHERLMQRHERLQVIRVVQQEPARIQSTKVEIKLSEKDKAKLRLIKAILEKLTGRKVRLFLLELAESQQSLEQETQVARNQFVVVYEQNVYERETESVDFSAKGYVETKDGRRIEFEASFHVSRTLERSEMFRFTSGNLQDPLILKLDDAPLEFSDKKLTLDLDLDGTLDSVRLPKNAVLLVFDSNENGQLDDAHELFGPSTGNGFKELAMYDEGMNGWIDESDGIFVKLRVLRMKQEDLELVPLLEANVGAIYLGSVRTIFGLHDHGELLGKLNSSGIYLTEDGGVKTIHQIDLKV